MRTNYTNPETGLKARIESVRDGTRRHYLAVIRVIDDKELVIGLTIYSSYKVADGFARQAGYVPIHE